MIFNLLPGYARFIRDHYLIPYIQEQIRISREMNLPVLRFFKDVPNDELIAMAIPTHTNFLIAAEENRLSSHVERTMEAWMRDNLGTIKREEITARDITLSGYARKRALLKFLSSYTTDVSEALEIVEEIDAYTVASSTAATDIYLKLLNDRMSEQNSFTETLSNTTPGLNYVYDLAERKVKYANKNTLVFFGKSLHELLEFSEMVIPGKIHPDDIATNIDGLRRCAKAADGEVISWELRFLGADHTYTWMRNYASVLKRNEQGVPSEIVGIVLDINKEKEIADKLFLREKQLLEAQAQAQVGSFELDVDTGKMEVTPQFRDIYEVTDFDLHTLIDKVHPDDKQRINDNREKAISENGVYDNEYRYLTGGKEKIIWSRGIMTTRNGKRIMTGTVMDITTRQTMIRELTESRELYKQAQRLSHIGNWSWDIQTNRCFWSEELFRIYEQEPHDGPVDNEGSRNYRHPDDMKMVDEQMRRLAEEFIPCDYSYRIVLPSGSLKHLNVKADILYNDKGEAITMFGTVQDVTEKQLLINQLQASERLYKQAQAISHIGSWSWDLTTKKLDWSEELYRIYELEPDTAVVSEVIGLYNHPEDGYAVDGFMKNALETGEPFDFNYRIILPGNRIKILNARGEANIGPAGHPDKVYGTLQDITRQKQAEAKLEEYQKFITKITDVTPSIILAYNVHTGQYSFINEAVEKLLGYPASLIVKEGVAYTSALVHPDDVAMLMEKNAKAIEDANQLPAGRPEPIVEFKYRMLHHNGEYLWFHTYGTVFERNQHGMVESMLNISVDVTDQEKAEQALFQKNLQLQQSNTSLEEYAYVASHDLKEPLRKITTFGDRMLTTQASLGEDGKLYLSKIISSANRMQKMIGDLLSVSTISGNVAYELTDLNTLMAEALQPLDYKIEETKAVIEYEPLPALNVVPGQFRQLFQNLVGNSLKFARVGVPVQIKITHKFLGPKETMGLKLPKAKKYLRLKFIDNGIGFDNQYAQKIFAIFQRLHGKADYEGTGIGLALCKKIVENHRGLIYAEGAVNEGAIVTIILPI